MPIYEYECSECGLHFEQWQKVGDPLPGACPNGHSPVRRLLSQPAIIFKGSGFYATDHAPSGRNGSSTGRKPSKAKAPEPTSTPAAKEDH
jgi:putative FmdB family regulatory protein